MLVVKATACYLEHVCIAVMGVLHHHRLDSRQSVRDAVLVFVAYGLEGQREGRRQRRKEGGKEQKKEGERFSEMVAEDEKKRQGGRSKDFHFYCS